MKLELKHLSAYFPYDLDYWSVDDKSVNTLMKISHNGYGNLLLNNEHHEDRIKPYLYPLSDLTKEIEHNNELFIPAKHLFYDWRRNLDLKMDFRGGQLCELWLDYPDSNSRDYVQESTVTLDEWFKLFEWHFDVFGLIEKGLAIDINTLENEI